MAVDKEKSRSALGKNPLTSGIFSKTEGKIPDQEELGNQESRINILDPDKAIQPPEVAQPKTAEEESSDSSEKTVYLTEQVTERVNLRLSVEINDWLDNLLKQGKRKHGRKISKEIWVQAALEFFRALPVDWQTIESEQNLRATLSELEERINKEESIRKNQ